MPYLYREARKLKGKLKVGDFQCVALVRHFTNAPPALAWREGSEYWAIEIFRKVLR